MTHLHWVGDGIQPSHPLLSPSPPAFTLSLHDALPISDKVLYSQNYDFSSSHVQIREVDNKEGWTPKNWCFWIVVLEMNLESPLDSKEIKLVRPKENQPWIAGTPILWPPDAKSQLFGKDPDAGKDGGQEEKGATENKIVGWHYWLKGHNSGR